MATLDSATPQVSKQSFWIGTIMSWLPALLLLVNSVFMLMENTQIVSEVERLGFTRSSLRTAAILLIVFTVLYLIPNTSVLGAILLTIYQGGGATAHWRVGDGWPMIAIPFLIALLIWGGLYFKDKRIREVIPLKK